MVGQRFIFEPFVLDADRGALLRDGQPVPLGGRAVTLLGALLRADGQVVSKSALMEAVWPNTAVEESNLSVQVAALRKSLGPHPAGGEWIATVARIGYRFAGTSLAAGGTSKPVVPSIAVLPFTNAGADDYLADGIAEDIMTTLARFRWFSILVRNASFAFRDRPEAASELGARYLLQGTLRKSGQRFRISAQLIDVATSAQVWAERYDIETADIFAIQDEIADRVAGAIEPELLKTEGKRAANRPTSANAWDLVRQGTWQFHRVTRPTHLAARELFRQALRLDPLFAEAAIWLARVNAGIIAYGWSDNPVADGQEGLRAALEAIRLDDQNPYAHYGLAIISAYAGALDQARRAAARASELSPSFALGHLVLGMATLFDGDAAGAMAPLQRGLDLNPHDPQNFAWYNFLALAGLFAGAPEQALAAALRAQQVRPDWRPGMVSLTCAHVALGQTAEARHCLAALDRLSESPGDVLGPLRQHNPQWIDEIGDLLRRAAG